MPGADVDYFPSVPLNAAPHVLLDRLIKEVPWKAEEIVVRGRRYLQPRLTAWYGDPGRSYTYSGIRMDPLAWTELLTAIRNTVEAASGWHFNSVLLNLYRDHRDSMGFHSDDEPELGAQPCIASLSAGDERTFVFRHKSRRDIAPVRLSLASGSLLVMKGDTQKNWKHGVDKEKLPCGPRVNLTFRTIVLLRRSAGGSCE